MLGGSFNPAHAGHRYISVQALKRLGLDEVWWLVSPQNPLKPERDMAPLTTRIALAQKVARHPRIAVTDLERRLGTRYTIDTIRALRRRYPRCRFVLLIGADLMTELPRWRRWQQLLTTLPVAVFDRPGYTRRALANKVALRFHRGRRRSEEARTLAKQTPPAWAFIRVAPHAASATALRAKAARKVKSRITRRRISHSPQATSPRRAVAALEPGRA